MLRLQLFTVQEEQTVLSLLPQIKERQEKQRCVEGYNGVQVVANQYDLADARLYGRMGQCFCRKRGYRSIFLRRIS